MFSHTTSAQKTPADTVDNMALSSAACMAIQTVTNHAHNRHDEVYMPQPASLMALLYAFACAQLRGSSRAVSWLCMQLQSEGTQAPQDLKEDLQQALHALQATERSRWNAAPLKSAGGKPSTSASTAVPRLSGSSCTLPVPAHTQGLSAISVAFLELAQPLVAVVYQQSDQGTSSAGDIVTVSKGKASEPWEERLQHMGSLVLWDTSNPKEPHSVCVSESSLQCAACGPESAPHVLLGGGTDGAIYCWHLWTRCDAEATFNGGTIRLKLPMYSTAHLATSAEAHESDQSFSGLGAVRCLRVVPAACASDGTMVTFSVVTLSAWEAVNSWKVTTWDRLDVSRSAAVSDAGLSSGAPNHP
jgi:hypothetical protein